MRGLNPHQALAAPSLVQDITLLRLVSKPILIVKCLDDTNFISGCSESKSGDLPALVDQRDGNLSDPEFISNPEVLQK